MKILIQSTEEISEVDGVPHRVWEGVSDSGIPMLLLIHKIMPDPWVCRKEQFSRFNDEWKNTKHVKIPNATPLRRAKHIHNTGEEG